MYALFIKACELINQHCLDDSNTRHVNLAISLDGYIWPVSSLATEHIQICCLEEAHLETIMLQLTLINVGNGCDIYTSNIYNPCKPELARKTDTSIKCDFFIGFIGYISKHGWIWYIL